MENCCARGRTGSALASRQQQVKSSWETEAACASGDQSGGSRSNLDKIVAVPWHKNEDDPGTDGETLTGGIVMMDRDYKEKLVRGEHVPVPKREHITRETLDEFGFTARCPGCMPLLRGTTRQAHNRMEAELKSTAKAEAAQRRAKEYMAGQS